MYIRICKKRKYASYILGDVARFTKSVNFTFLITVGNLSLAKMQFLLVAKQKTKLENNKLLFYIYVPNPFHGQKMRENYFGPEVEWTAFSGTAT